MREPVLRIDQRIHAALGATPVFDQDRPPPLDHAPLHGGRDRCGAVQRLHQLRRVEGRALGLGQPQQAHEHRRHEMHVRDLPTHQEIERLGLVPSGHDQDRRPVRVVIDREHQRRRVIHRPRDQMRPGAIEPDVHPLPRVRDQRLPDRRRRGALHALRSPGGAAGVDHVAAGRRVQIERSRNDRVEHAVELGPDAQRRRVRPRLRHTFGHSRITLVGYDESRARVPDDVVDLLLGQMPVDRRDPLPSHHGAEQQLDHFDAIAHQQREMPARLETGLMAQEGGEAMAAVEELGEAARAGPVVDREFGRALAGEIEKHGRRTFSIAREGVGTGRWRQPTRKTSPARQYRLGASVWDAARAPRMIGS